MELKTMVLALKKELRLSEGAAHERALTMLASVRGKHPRAEISDFIVGEVPVIVLTNGTRVRFDPSFPCPVWEYPPQKDHLPRRVLNRYERVMEVVFALESIIEGSPDMEAVRKAEQDLMRILKERSAKSVQDLMNRLQRACLSEMGEEV